MVLALTLLSLALVQPTPQPQAVPPGPSAPAMAEPPAEPARPVRVDVNPEIILYLKDGSVFQGLLVKQDDKVCVIEIAGVPVTFAADRIDHVRTLAPVLERYRELRTATPETDIDQRITLIRWLADRKQVELALAEAELLLTKNPKHFGATRLAGDLRTRYELLVKPAIPAGDEADRPEPAAAPGDERITPREFPFLTEAQVALMKVFEVDLAARPRVIFPRDAAARMLEEYASSPLVPASREGKDAILRQDPLETVGLMFRLRARSYYETVHVVDQPEPMRRFRDDVQRVTLMGGCATSQCHGGRDAGRLVLSTYRPHTDITLYTNYYILNNFRTADGQPLIDWNKPEQSLLLQLALPRELSRFRHPSVISEGKEVWRAPLTGPDDRRAAGIVDWIKSAYRPRPDYSLDYTPFRPFTPPPTAGTGSTGGVPAEPVVR
ncbi:MAG: hypothetical protein Q8L55_09525 [Phycisphaerales bacterium]|nr:hypothetical protein [Phycisphaerales bacterium]